MTLKVNRKTCVCGRTTGRCPECGHYYSHGSVSRCSNKFCEEVNAPIDCVGCKRVVSDDLDGVITLEMELIPWR